MAPQMQESKDQQGFDPGDEPPEWWHKRVSTFGSDNPLKRTPSGLNGAPRQERTSSVETTGPITNASFNSAGGSFMAP
eukprot:CAMPEP_0118997616 /NCGR_PEP_ID=MMETSP1173-20130426/62055_1 /TAXON_ID=1034831 /ORGANISM="Rhizochromulina marina cf, Strain CCMP1243" /LENGTH=77 /DNA_ID=CAMNT_0006949073 /DNA_START=1 /DNA_END=230 /DNA_ORIENTATION=+